MQNYLLTVGILFLCCNKSEKTENPSNNPPPPTNRFNINASLVTPNATTEATALYKFLKDNYGKNILSGVMTLNSFDETNWLKTNTGKEPAIIGLDFMHCNRGYSWYD